MEELKVNEDPWVVNKFSFGSSSGMNLEKFPAELNQCYENKAYDTANEIIRTYSTDQLLSGNYQSYINLINNLQKCVFEYLPLLYVYLAIAMFFSEYPCTEVVKVLGKIEGHQNSKEFISQMAAIKAIIASHIENPEKGIQLSLKALSLIDPEDTLLINLVERNLGVAFTLKNELSKANFWLERLLSSSYKLKDWGGVLAAYNYLTYIRKVQGRFHEANIIYRKAIEFINEYHLEHLPHSIKIFSGYGHLLLQWNQVKEAKENLQIAIQFASEIDIFYGHNAYQNLIEAYIFESDIAKAYETIKYLRELTIGKAELYERIHTEYTAVLETRIYLEDGRVNNAYDWLTTSGLELLSIDQLQAKFGFELGFILPIIARIYIAKGMFDRAIQVLNSVIPRFQQQGSISFLIRSLNVLSIAYFENEQIMKSIKTIHKAIKLAEPENNIGDFLFAGKLLEKPLLAVYQVGLYPDFIHQLLRKFAEFKVCKNYIYSTRILKSLSQREMDVLQLIACGLTNREIAMKLFLSSNTIKSHSINIYRKLNVNNRRQAVNKAQKIGLIPENNNGSSHVFPISTI